MPTRAIKSIFFTRFHPAKGCSVLHEVPEGSITPSSSPSALRAPLFDFSAITTYLIPKQEFCDRLLTFCTNHYRIIGYPVCIREGRYERNEFIFNLALVVEESVRDWVAYADVVRKLGRLLRGLEEQSCFLSREETGVLEEEGSAGALNDTAVAKGKFSVGGGSKVYALCEMVLEDLNNYAECMIPIDDSNTINLKLFPTRPPPPPVHAHQVPVLTISLSSLSAPISSDLTLNRILPFINGINSVARIAQLADTDLSLTRKAIQHLVYYGCLVLLDIFSFGAVYAPTAEIGGFVVDPSVQEECARYVYMPSMSSLSLKPKRGSDFEKERSLSAEERSSVSSRSQRSDYTSSRPPLDPWSSSRPANESTSDTDEHSISHDTLIQLYTSLRQGLTLKAWVLENVHLLAGIDIRRLITFGIIKGFLYRVHKYAIATSASLPPAPPTSLQSTPASTSKNHSREPSSDQLVATIRQRPPGIPPTSASAAVPVGSSGAARTSAGQAEEITRLESLVSEERERGETLPLVRFLDGMHCFDEICTELGLAEKELEGKVKGWGDVYVFSR